jgi:hypothetical protein
MCPGLAGENAWCGTVGKWRRVWRSVSEADLGKRIGEVRRRLALDGPPWTRAVDGDFDRVAVPERDCDRLRDLLITEGVGTGVEIGLAYGSSALAIGEAPLTVGAPRPQHIIIDPVQDTEWRDVGWQLLRSAGLDQVAELIRQPSSMALPASHDSGTPLSRADAWLPRAFHTRSLRCAPVPSVRAFVHGDG